MKKILLIGTGIIIIIGSIVSYKLYSFIYTPNINENITSSHQFFIPTGTSYEELLQTLEKEKILINQESFKQIANRKNLKNHIHPGKYKIKAGMSNNGLINLLRSGKQDPIKLTFNNIRTKEDFVSRVCSKLEADSTELLNILNNRTLLKEYGFSSQNCISMFIPNTYELYWNTSAKTFIKRMFREYKQFWTESRRQKASAIGLTPIEVSILASIVIQETQKTDEMATVAGVYINRIKKGMLLQADPTVVFASGDFLIKRVLNKHKKIDSPYNTYMYKGLPPGPICMPSPVALNKVLNYHRHDYIFFCAKEDFSGYHNFAKTYRQHNKNARRYQKALDVLNIR